MPGVQLLFKFMVYDLSLSLSLSLFFGLGIVTMLLFDLEILPFNYAT